MRLRLANDNLRPANPRQKMVDSSFATRLSRHNAMRANRSSLSGFTLVELILVMALLVVAVSFITPHLSDFFRGRALDSEGRQLMALVHDGQSRAVSGGVPMILWFDAAAKKYG